MAFFNKLFSLFSNPKNKRGVSDHDANYDIDGVSYTTEGVTVAGDGHHAKLGGKKQKKSGKTGHRSSR